MSIQQTLNILNIKIDKKLSNNRVMCKCIWHEDKDPSLMIDLTSGLMHCFGCKRTTSIVKQYQNHIGSITYKEAYEFVFDGQSDNTFVTIEKQENFTDNLKQQKIQLLKNNNSIIDEREDVLTAPLKVEQSNYLQQRGFTNEFLKEFNIKLAINDRYMDYAYIPINSDKLKIYTFECRKIFELEYLQKLFNTKSKSLFRLQAKFKNKKSEYKNSIYYNYLIQPKTYYPFDSVIKHTLFNYDNLNLNEDLVVTEGIPSVAKIYQYINKNVTSLYGTIYSDNPRKEVPEQIKLLKKFTKKIIIIPDNDLACYLMISYLNKFLNNIYVYDIITEDTHDIFVEDIQNCSILKANEFLIKREFFEKFV